MAKIVKKLQRPAAGSKERKIAGVAAGLAEYFGVDVIAIRLLLVLLLIPGGIPGILVYLLAWLIIPEKK